mmetsp:Transcript_39789/g.86760  ORF Transcript_39789/g.86760 Transcript_39789/m.86760 type:complete len:202 (+) Transcript_39789:762-1367(+)
MVYSTSRVHSSMAPAPSIQSPLPMFSKFFGESTSALAQTMTAIAASLMRATKLMKAPPKELRWLQPHRMRFSSTCRTRQPSSVQDPLTSSKYMHLRSSVNVALEPFRALTLSQNVISSSRSLTSRVLPQTRRFMVWMSSSSISGAPSMMSSGAAPANLGLSAPGVPLVILPVFPAYENGFLPPYLMFCMPTAPACPLGHAA